jgi:phosphoribosyl 1,2-cyclic phosphodiesterase
MAIQFHVLASGSSGNASLLDVSGFGILIDAGIGPRLLARRFAGPVWNHVHAAVLTHTHGDHWNENTLGQLRDRRIPLWCHARHEADLAAASPTFGELRAAGLVERYETGATWPLGAGCRCTAFEVQHDSGVTCGFRFEGLADIFGDGWALAYAADLGCWTPEIAGRLADADVVALEFNHDVGLQCGSGRPVRLIRRVLGDRGHLSNAQAADLLAAVLKRSTAGRLQYVVQLHLSQQCNTPELAHAAARHVLDTAGCDVQIHTSEQHRAGPSLTLGQRRPVVRPARGRSARRVPASVRMPSLFPDWE